LLGSHYDCLRAGGSSEDGLMARSRRLPIYRHYRVLFEVGSFSGLTYLTTVQRLARCLIEPDRFAQVQHDLDSLAIF